jgi:hypothetical protein
VRITENPATGFGSPPLDQPEVRMALARPDNRYWDGSLDHGCVLDGASLPDGSLAPEVVGVDDFHVIREYTVAGDHRTEVRGPFATFDRAAAEADAWLAKVTRA